MYLVHAGAAHDGHALAEREEGGVQRVGEADVVRRQRPAHAPAAHQRARVQHACNTHQLISSYTFCSKHVKIIFLWSMAIANHIRGICRLRC